jgi:hypothetical protein
MDIPARVVGKFTVNAQSGCWEWSLSQDRHGYGQIKVDGKMLRAHRWVYREVTGVDLAGVTLDHLCRVRHCVNPNHLEPVTQEVNNQRGLYARKEYCINGHAYLPGNLVIDNRGRRRCRQCERDKYRRYNAKRAKN